MLNPRKIAEHLLKIAPKHKQENRVSHGNSDGSSIFTQAVNKKLETFTNLDNNGNISNITESASSFASAISRITDQTYLNELLKSDEEIIEIILNVDAIEKNSEVLKKLNEVYGNVQKSILIAFSSIANGNSLIFWRNRSIEMFLQLNLSFNMDKKEATELNTLTRKFIMKSFEENFFGLADNLIEDDKWKLVKLELTQLADSRGYNLLMFAAEVNAINLISQLLKIGFSVNDRVEKDTSADVAWQNGNFDLLLLLLNNNSCLPKGLNTYSGTAEEIPQSLKQFFKFTEDFFRAIDAGNVAEVTSFIEKNPNLRHFYSIMNCSAPKFALLRKNLQMYEFFMEKNITFGPFEPITKTIEDLSDTDREKLRIIHFKHTKNLPEQHINILIANSNLGHDIDKIEEKRNYVEKAYHTLNSIALIQIILKCVAAAKKFNIIFDFNRKNVQFLDPTMDSGSDGLFDSSIGRLYIGAKQIFDPKTENEVYGTIIHELCHFAMFLVYNNNGKPYYKHDKKSKVKFDRISKQCERRSKSHDLMDAVYECYDEYFWHAELIVRVPHLTAVYHNDPEKLERARKTYKSLFDFFEHKVMKDMERVLPLIGLREEEKMKQKKNENWILRVTLVLMLILLPFTAYAVYSFVKPLPEQDFAWENLTNVQHNEITTSDFNFQGQRVKITDVIGNLKFFHNLDASVAKAFIIDGEIIKIDKEVGKKKTFYIERQFIEREGDDERESKTFDDISVSVKKKNLSAFILSDEAGTGKSTTFMNLTEKIKFDFKYKWISFVAFKDHVDALNGEAVNEQLDDFLGQKVLKLNSFNLTIFKKLFNENKTVFVWDGFDEVSPLYENFVLNLLTKIANETKNIQFVSTRTLYTEKLENALNVKAHKFVPYTVDDREDFLISYAEENRFTIRKAIKSHSYLERFLKKVEGSDKTRDVNNPLMLEIFLETAKEKFTKTLNDASINFYSLYDNFIKRKNDIFYEKFVQDKDKLFELKEKDKRNHQILALNLIFKDIGIRDMQTGEIHNVSSLDIMSNIDNFSVDNLSRIGIIDVYRNSITNETELNFGHRTFAEYFIAQYLIESFYQVEYKPRDEEMVLRFKLLLYVLTDENFKIIQQFLDDFMSEINESNLKLPSRVYSNVIDSNFEHIFDYVFLIDESLTFVDRISHFFKIDSKILNSLWRLNDNETHFIWFFKECTKTSFDDANKVAVKYFPNAADHNKLIFGDNQMGNIIFALWLQRDDESKKSWNQFYVKNLHNDIRLKNLDNMDISKILNTNADDEKEILMKNSYKILQLLYFDEKVNLDVQWVSIRETLDVDMDKFLMGTDWKTNNTILHEIGYKGNLRIATDFMNKTETFLTKNEIKSLVSWQNRGHQNTPFILAAKNQDINFVSGFWDFLHKKLNFESLKNVLKLRNFFGVSALMSSMSNDHHQHVFSYIKGLYEYYFSLNETREYFKGTQRGSLKFMHNENADIDEKKYMKLTEYLERIFITNLIDLRHLFATNDDDFKQIFNKFINSDGNSKISSLISLLSKALTSEERDEIAIQQNQKLENFLLDNFKSKYGDKVINITQTIENDTNETSKVLMNDVINMVQEFFTHSLNTLVDSQIDFFKMFSSDEKFYEILLSDDCKETGSTCFVDKITHNSTNSTSNSQNATDSANDCVEKPLMCLHAKSVYSLFNSHINSTFQAKFKKKNANEAIGVYQLLAIKEATSSEYVNGLLSKLPLFLFVTKVHWLRRNVNETYSFEYKPYQHILVAQYFIENLYKNKNPSNDLPSQFQLLVDIWSLKCDCRKISNFVSNYIENEDPKETVAISSQLNTLVLLNHSELLSKIDITMIDAASLFFQSDEEVLRRLWKVDADESIYYAFIKNNRVDELNYLSSVAKKFFNSSDMQKITNLSGQKGKVLYYAWDAPRQLTSFDLEKTLWKLDIDGKLIDFERFREMSNSIEFFNYVSDFLSLDDQKALIHIDTERFFLRDIFDIDLTTFEVFWAKIVKVLSEEELNEIIIKKDSTTNVTMIHNAVKIKTLDYLKSFFAHITQILNQTQYIDMMMWQDSINETPMMKFISYNSKHDFTQAFWSVSEKLLNKSQQKEILSVKNFDDTALQTSMFTILRDIKTFKYVTELYGKLFTVSEIQDLMVNESDVKIDQYLTNNTFPTILKFLLEIFESDEKKFLYYLSRRINNLTIFERNKGVPLYQQNLQILKGFVENNFSADDLKALGLE